MKNNISSPLQFACGQQIKNRFMLAPLTNRQSHEDGSLSDEEFNWLVMRAKGQFGLVMTCASHVQKNGKGFKGQLGIYSDDLLPGHQRLVKAIQAEGSLAVIQLHHAGMRSPKELIEGAPMCPSTNEKFGASAMSHEAVIQLRNDFIAAAVRAQKAGYDGVEIHGAHGYILAQFLSSEVNFREDEYGGSLTNRARIIFEIIEEIRKQCGQSFLIGIRLSPERFGMDIDEVRTISQALVDTGQIDFLDISLWDVFKAPEEEKYPGKLLLDYFTDLDFKEVKFTVAGKIRNGEDVQYILNKNVDFVSIGRSGILHHDFPQRVMDNPKFKAIDTPVSKSYLAKEGLSPVFIEYMEKWPGFVEG